MTIKMNMENASKKNIICISEIIKWSGVVVLFMVSIVGNYLCRNYSVVLRGIVVILMTIIAMYVVSVTRIGKLLVKFGKESRAELRQIVWPTYRDGLNTTFVVVAVTVVVSLVLWGLDAIAVNVISCGLRL